MFNAELLSDLIKNAQGDILLYHGFYLYFMILFERTSSWRCVL